MSHDIEDCIILHTQTQTHIKTFLTLKLSQYHKSDSMLSSSKPVAADWETPYVCAWHQQVVKVLSAPKSLNKLCGN